MVHVIALLALSSLGDFQPSARLLAAADTTGPQKAQLQVRLREVERALATPDDGWGAGHAVAAVVGFALAPAVLVGLVIGLVGLVDEDGVMAAVGGGLMLLGGAAFGTGIWAVGAGTTHMNDAKNRRYALHKEKQGIEEQLDALDDAGAAPLPPPPSALMPRVWPLG